MPNRTSPDPARPPLRPGGEWDVVAVRAAVNRRLDRALRCAEVTGTMYDACRRFLTDLRWTTKDFQATRALKAEREVRRTGFESQVACRPHDPVARRLLAALAVLDVLDALHDLRTGVGGDVDAWAAQASRQLASVSMQSR